MIYQRAQIAAAWCVAGGDPGASVMASAVALAESGGYTDAISTIDGRAGLWQGEAHTGTSLGLDLLDPVDARPRGDRPQQ